MLKVHNMKAKDGGPMRKHFLSRSKGSESSADEENKSIIAMRVINHKAKMTSHKSGRCMSIETVSRT